jgi:chromosomal replication initiation ATPase DnaA
MLAGSSSSRIEVCGRQRTSRARSLPERALRQLLEHAVAQVFIVPSAELWSHKRGRPPVAFARQVAMYLAHVHYGLSLRQVGNVFARDRTTVSHACSVIEDRRDDPRFDRALECIEAVLRFLSSAQGRLI